MEFGILGPLEVRREGCAVALGGAKPRAVLAVLLLHANEPVSAERLAVALWGDEAPSTATRTAQVHVSRLRHALSDDRERIVSGPAGYCLRVAPGELDRDRFELLVEQGRRALADRRAGDAATALRDALALWRGRPLGDLAFEPFSQAEIARLWEMRLGALEMRVDADLAVGRHAELVPELRRLVGEDPLRERLHGQLMLALYRSGRQADALNAYRQARELLVERLGIEPGVELQALQRAILAHDPTIAAAAAISERDPDDRNLRVASSRRPPGRLGFPNPPNRTIGREHELGAVVDRLRTPSVRLVALTGPGGVGKTRLALEAGRALEAEFADGAHFVSLAAVPGPEGVSAAIAANLGIVPLTGESPERAVVRFLAVKHLLLVLDNFEHVLVAGTFLSELLASCPRLTVLATSREPLRIAAEECFTVLPLRLPEPGITKDPVALASVDAIAMFSERARAHDPAFRLDDTNALVVAELCRRLDGLPLALELAAARCGLMSPHEIAERLDSSLRSLATGPRDAPARQHTLRATIEWSHDLLTSRERVSFAQLAVFDGGASIPAAEAITSVDLETLEGLVRKNLLLRVQRPYERTRLRMLETVRVYACERFAATTDRRAIERRHFRFFRDLAERHGTEKALLGSGRRQHLAALDADVDNLHAAVRWALDTRDAADALAIVAALGRYWLVRNQYAKAACWIERALALPGVQDHPALRVQAINALVHALWPLGRGAEAPQRVAEAENIARECGDPLVLTRAFQLAVKHETGAGGRHRFAVAEPLANEALRWAEISGDEWEISQAWLAKARFAADVSQLHERLTNAVPRLQAVGNLFGLQNMLNTAAYEALCLGSDRDALQLVTRALPIARELGEPLQWAICNGTYGLAALLTGDPDTAHDAFSHELRVCRELVLLPPASEGLIGLAAIAALHAEDARAARLAGAAAAHRFHHDDPALAKLRETFLDPARDRLGVSAWDIAAGEGGALSFEAAIADALQEPRLTA